MFAEVTGEKLVGEPFLPPPPPILILVCLLSLLFFSLNCTSYQKIASF